MTATLQGWRSSFVVTTVSRFVLPIWFAAFAVVTTANFASHGYLLLDLPVYRHAAEIAISGGDPWAPAADGLAFAGPPPSLLPFIPLAFLPETVAVVVGVAVLLGAAAWTVRALRLPLWWLLFPPLFEALLAGNVDVLVLAFLVVAGPLAGLAGVFKVYGFVPLLLERRWWAVAVGAAVSLLSLPWWSMFLSHRDAIAATLAAQSEGFSAWGTWLMIPVVIALWVLRRAGASRLVVPALWPDTQAHYAAMSLPAVRRYPLAAAIIGLTIPFAAPIAVILMAVLHRWFPAPEPEVAP
jgi:hypothetical protein